MNASPRFSEQSIEFLKKASRQKNAAWLEKNQEDYDRLLRAPLQHLAEELKNQLGAQARGYHFPQKGIGRLKRPIHKVRENGGGIFKSWLSYSATKPSGSRFEHNPNLYFMIDSDDADDPVLVAGGLYMPSSKQLRAVREAIAYDATPFERLFRTKDFARCFAGGFSRDKTATRPPRGFDPNHPKIDWLKLQAFFVWRSYSKREFASKDFASIVARDWEQILRLNELLDDAIRGTTRRMPPPAARKSALLDRLADVGTVQRKMDF